MIESPDLDCYTPEDAYSLGLRDGAKRIAELEEEKWLISESRRHCWAERDALRHEVEVLTRLRPYGDYEWPTVLELERRRKQAEADLAKTKAR